MSASVRRCVLVSAVFLLSPVLGQRALAQNGAEKSPGPGGSAPPSAALRPGDVVRLKIWREPDLSGDFQINESGVVVFPRIGPVTANAQTPDSLRMILFRGYSAILSHTSIEVIFLRRVQILGAVRNPGLYPLDPTMTIGDALAVAGGTTPDGDPDRLELRREGAKLALKLDRRARVAESSIRSGDQLFIPERRWSARNSGIIATALAAGVSLTIALLRR